MEELKRKSAEDMNDKEILFSKSIKAGKRIYYLDVKKNRKDEMFLAITESKKVVTVEGEESLVTFEKHKIFLYKEDFEKFMNGLNQAIRFILEEQGTQENASCGRESAEASCCKGGGQRKETVSLDAGEIKIDIDF